jgi:hypothetical protein
MARLFDFGALIVGGVIVAGLIMPKNNTGLRILINGVQGLWSSSINGLLGSTS